MDLGGLEEAARERLDAAIYDYVAGGAADEITATENVDAWRAMRLRPHVLQDVSAVSTATTVLGCPVASPVLVAPTAMHGLFCADGELATARAAAAHGTVLTLSTVASTALEDVAATTPDAPKWMQLYVQKDHRISQALCARAQAAGYAAIVLTVDSPVLAKRVRNERNAFNVPPGMRLPNLVPLDHDGSDLDLYALVGAYEPALTFDDLAMVREWAGGLPVVVKGVLRGDDAARCVDAGAAAVIVSNHGGRQLDTVVATAHALPEVVAAVDGRAEVYVDGGVRTGVDVLKALTLGARAVLVGRSVVWGLAVDGEAGARAVLDELAADLARTMAFCGITAVTAVPRDLVTP
jgi:4-hydroxymandelate oxidase